MSWTSCLPSLRGWFGKMCLYLLFDVLEPVGAGHRKLDDIQPAGNIRLGQRGHGRRLRRPPEAGQRAARPPARVNSGCVKIACRPSSASQAQSPRDCRPAAARHAKPVCWCAQDGAVLLLEQRRHAIRGVHRSHRCQRPYSYYHL